MNKEDIFYYFMWIVVIVSGFTVFTTGKVFYIFTMLLGILVIAFRKSDDSGL